MFGPALPTRLKVDEAVKAPSTYVGSRLNEGKDRVCHGKQTIRVRDANAISCLVGAEEITPKERASKGRNDF